MKDINVQVLIDFADKRKKVDPFVLVQQAEDYYKSIKILGIEKTSIAYDNCTAVGYAISPLARAFGLHIMRMIYRWDDLNGGRLEEHYRLDMPSSVILADTGVLKRNGADLACTNIDDMINTWAIN